MVRALTFVPAMLCAAAIAAAQTPPKPDTNPPAVQQPAPQQPTTQPPASQRPAQPMIDAVSKVTYTGCVKPGTAVGTWVLDNAEMARPAGLSGQTGSTPATGTVGTTGIGKSTFSLSTKPGTDLKPHANHKVEIVGSVAPAKLSMPGSPSAGPSDHQEFTVESVKMVSTTCP
jgi:hypothetical protein